MKKGSWLAVVAVVALGAGWLAWRASPSEARASAPAGALPAAAGPGALPPPVPSPARVASAEAKPAAAAPNSPASAPPRDSAADLLRKVQVGLDGSAIQSLEAANVLQSCAHAAESAEGMRSARELWSMVPAFIKKFVDSLGGISDEQVERAQDDARRCQVFDEATLARRGELFRKAYEGGAPASAVPYLIWLTHDGQGQADAATTAQLQAEVRNLAQAGDFATLAAFAFTVEPQTYGASPVEREAYKQAWLRIIRDGDPAVAASNAELIAKLERLSRASPLTAQQQQQAQAMAQKVYDSYRQHP